MSGILMKYRTFFAYVITIRLTVKLVAVPVRASDRNPFLQSHPTSAVWRSCACVGVFESPVTRQPWYVNLGCYIAVIIEGSNTRL